jgi:hypothetical protein
MELYVAEYRLDSQVGALNQCFASLKVVGIRIAAYHADGQSTLVKFLTPVARWTAALRGHIAPQRASAVCRDVIPPETTRFTEVQAERAGSDGYER